MKDRFVVVKKASNGFILKLYQQNDDGDEKVKESVSSDSTLGVEIQTMFRSKIRTKKKEKEETTA